MSKFRDTKLLVPARRLSKFRAALFVGITATVGAIVVWAIFVAGTPIGFKAGSGTHRSRAITLSPSSTSGGAGAQRGREATPMLTGSLRDFPDATNRPHMISSNVMAYTDANGVAQTITLKSLPAPGSSFGINSGGTPNNCAYYDPRGWVNVGANCVIDGYNFDGVAIGNILGSNVTVSRNWFHEIDGQNSWCVWIHDHGNLSGLTITDNLCHGTTGSGANVLTGLAKIDGPMSNVVIERNQVYNSLDFVQFAPITGSGTTPYGNIVADNYVHNVSDGGPTINGHVEIINVSAGPAVSSFIITTLPVPQARLRRSTFATTSAMSVISLSTRTCSMVSRKTRSTAALPATRMVS